MHNKTEHKRISHTSTSFKQSHTHIRSDFNVNFTFCIFIYGFAIFGFL